jgi:hypothetical protein
MWHGKIVELHIIKFWMSGNSSKLLAQTAHFPGLIKPMDYQSFLFFMVFKKQNHPCMWGVILG